MSYYVILGDGRRFGPADVPTLNSWILQNRVGPNTILEDVTTGNQYQASTVSGLNFPSDSPPPIDAPPSVTYESPTAQQHSPFANPSVTNPYATPPQPMSTYPRGGQPAFDDGRNELTWSFVCSFGGIALCCCFPAAIGGVVLGNKAKAKGNPNAKAAVIVSWVALAVGLLYWIFALSMSTWPFGF